MLSFSSETGDLVRSFIQMIVLSYSDKSKKELKGLLEKDDKNLEKFNLLVDISTILVFHSSLSRIAVSSFFLRE